jgi:4-hydroxybenzoate polyprenyltransferase
MESVVTASALMAYALWTLEGADTPWMLATLPFVAYAIFRYQYISESTNIQQPEYALIKDKGMILSILVWSLSSIFILIIFK